MIPLDYFLFPSQSQIFKSLSKKFKGKSFISKNNFILVKGETPILLVAHLDTVHDEPVKIICKSDDGNIWMSPQGIGGDDRCGVFVLVNSYELAPVKPFLLFTCNEEIGGIGSEAFCFAHQTSSLPFKLENLKLIIEVDRKGSNDAVFYNCHNSNFEKYITGKGFKTAQGSFSDISLIAPALGVAAVNLSSGYYNPHFLHEYINYQELKVTLNKIIDIIADSCSPDFPRYEYIKGEKLAQQQIISVFDDFNDSINIPFDCQEIYDELLDFYSPDELDAWHKDFGDSFLLHLYDYHFRIL